MTALAFPQAFHRQAAWPPLRPPTAVSAPAPPPAIDAAPAILCRRTLAAIEALVVQRRAALDRGYDQAGRDALGALLAILRDAAAATPPAPPPQPDRYAGALELPDVFGLLRRACQQAGGQSVYADTHGLSRQVVRDVNSGRSNPGPDIVRALDLRELRIFLRRESGL